MSVDAQLAFASACEEISQSGDWSGSLRCWFRAQVVRVATEEGTARSCRDTVGQVPSVWCSAGRLGDTTWQSPIEEAWR